MIGGWFGQLRGEKNLEKIARQTKNLGGGFQIPPKGKRKLIIKHELGKGYVNSQLGGGFRYIYFFHKYLGK